MFGRTIFDVCDEIWQGVDKESGLFCPHEIKVDEDNEIPWRRIDEVCAVLGGVGATEHIGSVKDGKMRLQALHKWVGLEMGVEPLMRLYKNSKMTGIDALMHMHENDKVKFMYAKKHMKRATRLVLFCIATGILDVDDIVQYCIKIIPVTKQNIRRRIYDICSVLQYIGMKIKRDKSRIILDVTPRTFMTPRKRYSPPDTPVRKIKRKKRKID